MKEYEIKINQMAQI